MSLEEAPVTDAPKLNKNRVCRRGVGCGGRLGGSRRVLPPSCLFLVPVAPQLLPWALWDLGLLCRAAQACRPCFGAQRSVEGRPWASGNLQVGSHVYLFPPQNVSKFGGSVPKVEKCV